MNRWAPDEQLIEAVIAATGRRYLMTKLDGPDRCWVVAGLSARGYTAEAIAERLHCSLRLVRAIRAEPMTTVCSTLIAESDHFTDELRLVRAEAAATGQALKAALSERDRLRERLVRVTTPEGKAALCPKGRHEMTRYNTYTYTDSRGRQRSECRACHAERQAAHRAKRAVS